MTAPRLRVGLGYDVHRLVPGRPLILGGVPIPFALGLAGHSDADVLIHALMDALLGAAGLGDIGQHFPPDDPTYHGASSLWLLERVIALLDAGGWRPVNVDCSVIAEAPKLLPHLAAMRANLGPRLGLAGDAVGLKATTNERLGFVGREEGIAALAVALIERTG